MHAELIDQTTPPMPRTIQFLPSPHGVGAQLPPPDFVRFPLEPILVNAASPTREQVDELMHQVVQRYGHSVDRIEQATFDIVPPLPPTEQDRQGRRPDFTVSVRRDRRHGTFVARASVTLAYGYGNTIGEAFRDCMDDFLYRQALLYAERDRLGPGLQAELREMEHLTSGAQ